VGEQLPGGVPEVRFEGGGVEFADGLVDGQGDVLGGEGEEEGGPVEEEEFQGEGVLVVVAAEVEGVKVREEKDGGGVGEERPVRGGFF